MSLEIIVASTSIAVATLAALQGGIRSLAARISLRDQRKKLASLRVREVLARADLHSLGSMIVDDLGATSIPNYVRHREVRDSFRNAFNAARGFIGEPSEPASKVAEAAVGPSAHDRPPFWRDDPVTKAATVALRDVAEGETWNALARMRREFELELAARLDLDQGSRRPMAAGQLLAVAVKQGVVPADLASSIRYAISVANRAVHGEEVPPDAAVEAIYLIDTFIRSLGESGNSSGRPADH